MRNKNYNIATHVVTMSLYMHTLHAYISLHMYAYRVAAWIGYYQLLPEIIRYFPYTFKIHELPGGKNVWK